MTASESLCVCKHRFDDHHKAGVPNCMVTNCACDAFVSKTLEASHESQIKALTARAEAAEAECTRLHAEYDAFLADHGHDGCAVAQTTLTAQLQAAEADAKELRALFDAFMEGQEASIGQQPRESNPYPPGDSYAINPRWAQWDDGYACNINRALQAKLQAAEATIATLRELVSVIDRNVGLHSGSGAHCSCSELKVGKLIYEALRAVPASSTEGKP